MPLTQPPSTIGLIAQTHNMLDDGVINYWFHHKPSFPSLNPSIYEYLISTATRSIDIWEPYIHMSNGDDKDLVIFNSIKNGVNIRILTRAGLTGSKVSYLSDVYTKVQTRITSNKNVSFCIGAIDLSQRGGWDFHDRFLILDNQHVFLVGASIEFYHTQLRTCGIYQIQNIDTCNFIIDQFDDHWNQTKKHPLSGLQLL